MVRVSYDKPFVEKEKRGRNALRLDVIVADELKRRDQRRLPAEVVEGLAHVERFDPETGDDLG